MSDIENARRVVQDITLQDVLGGTENLTSEQQAARELLRPEHVRQILDRDDSYLDDEPRLTGTDTASYYIISNRR